MTSSCTTRGSSERPISSESRWMHGNISQIHQQCTIASSSMHHVVRKAESTQTMKNPMDSGQLRIYAISQNSNTNYSLSHTKISENEVHSSTRHVLSHPRKTSESYHTFSESTLTQYSKISISDLLISHGGHLGYQDLMGKDTAKI